MIPPRSHHRAIDAAKLRRKRGLACVVWVVIVALLGLLFMPMPGDAGVTLVTVCTDDGVKQVALDAEGKSVPLHHHQTHQGGACPFCIGHAGYSLPPPVAAPSPPRVVIGGAIGFAVAAGVLPSPHFLTGRQTRAPPALAT